MVILPDEPGLASSPVTHPLLTYSLTPFHHVLLRQEKGLRWRKRSGRKVHSMRGNLCRDIEAKCRFCPQPVLQTCTGTHPFFSHQQTPQLRNVAASYVNSSSQFSIMLIVCRIISNGVWIVYIFITVYTGVYGETWSVGRRCRVQFVWRVSWHCTEERSR